MKDQKTLQSDIASELESLTFEELEKIGILINKFYSRSNKKPTIIINLCEYVNNYAKKRS